MSDKKDIQATRPSRRDFLKSSTAATVLAAPYIVSASALGASAASNRITLGCIGTGNQGFPNMKRFLEIKDCQVVAVCDVNRGSNGYKEEDHYYGREPARAEVERHYSQSQRSGNYKGCAAYNDFRELLARKDIDAVMIAAPDHWHGIMTVLAAEAGKDIYCEKPLGLSIGQQQTMVEAVRKHERVLQTGSHERSNPIIQHAVQLVQSGAIGKVKRVVTHVGRNNKIGPGPGWQSMPIPDGFDYDLWLGPAPSAPFHEDRCLYRFRFNYDYSGGQITNFGAHSNDIAQWGLGKDGTGPTSVEYGFAEFPPEGSLFNTATYTYYRCTYDDGTVLECQTAEPSVRCIFEGTDGMVRIDNQGQHFTTIPEGLKSNSFSKKDVHKYASNVDHQKNFIDCVKSRSEPAAPVEVGHRSATVCHLGNIAIRLKAKKLKWDPKAEQFVGSQADEANALLDRDVREPWRLELAQR